MQGEQLQQGEIRTSGAMACQGITGFGVFSQLSSLRLQQSQFETRATLKRHASHQTKPLPQRSLSSSAADTREPSRQSSWGGDGTR